MRIIQEALTFDDVLLVPGHSAVLPRDVELKTSLTRSISLNIPLISAAMDTVTEARMGIVTHRELRFESRYDEPVSRIMTPKEKLVTVKEGASRDELLRLLHQHRN